MTIFGGENWKISSYVMNFIAVSEVTYLVALKMGFAVRSSKVMSTYIILEPVVGIGTEKEI